MAGELSPEEIMLAKLADAIGELKAATARLEHGRASNRRAISWLVWAFTILAVGVSVIGWQVVNLSTENRRRINDIQGQRVTSIMESCEAQNARNRVAVRFLRRLPEAPGTPKRSARERERLLRGFTDALVGPIESCQKRVERLAP